MSRFFAGLGIALGLVLLAGADVLTDSAHVQGVAAHNTATSGSPVLGAGVAKARGSAPAVVVAGNTSQLITDTDGRLYVSNVHPNTFSCLISNVTASTQCVGLSGAGLSYYVTDVVLNNGATAQSLQVVSSTTAGNACATAPANVMPLVIMPVNSFLVWPMNTYLKATANSALCVTRSGATAFSAQLSGFIAP